jgi:hypothetical protein
VPLKLPCGCVDDSQLSDSDRRQGETCVAHTLPRLATRRSVGAWYMENTCPFCERVNHTGCACAERFTVTCPTCGLHTCNRLDMAHYCLRAITGLICPSTINKRTKYGKKDLAMLAEHPELNAVTATFAGKKSTVCAGVR